MEKLPMCRLCLAENVRMYVVVNKDLHELYERLTDNPKSETFISNIPSTATFELSKCRPIEEKSEAKLHVPKRRYLRSTCKKLHRHSFNLSNTFVTGDSRPMLACFICCTKLKQCCQLQRKCLEAEELLTQMMNEDYEQNPLINKDRFGCFNGLIQSPMVHVSINSDDECQTECHAIKEELPAVCERLDDVIEPEEEHQSDELELENLYSSHSDAEVIPEQQSESDSEDDEPLIEIKTEVEEEQEVPRKKRRASDTTLEY